MSEEIDIEDIIHDLWWMIHYGDEKLVAKIHGDLVHISIVVSEGKQSFRNMFMGEWVAPDTRDDGI